MLFHNVSAFCCITSFFAQYVTIVVFFSASPHFELGKRILLLSLFLLLLLRFSVFFYTFVKPSSLLFFRDLIYYLPLSLPWFVTFVVLAKIVIKFFWIVFRTFVTFLLIILWLHIFLDILSGKGARKNINTILTHHLVEAFFLRIIVKFTLTVPKLVSIHVHTPLSIQSINFSNSIQYSWFFKWRQQK